MSEPTAAEPELIGDEFATPVAVAPALSLFGDDPLKAYAKMNACVEVIKQAFKQHSEEFVKPLEFGSGERKRTTNHVKIEGWTFVGALVGVTARTRSVARIEGEFDGTWWEDKPDGDGRRKQSGMRHGHGYRAMAEAVTLTGAVVGGAIGMCVSTEERWTNSDEYARSSMAQTRARSQAIAGVLRFLVEMAGYSGTPAEEMDGVQARQERRVEGPKREKIDGWGKLVGRIDEVSGFTEGVSKGLYAHCVAATWGIEITKWNDIEVDPGGSERFAEAKFRLHKVMWDLQAATNTFGVAELPAIELAWTTHWPLEEGSQARDELVEKIRAAAGAEVEAAKAVAAGPTEAGADAADIEFGEPADGARAGQTADPEPDYG